MGRWSVMEVIEVVPADGREGTAHASWRPFLTAVSTFAIVGVLGLAVTAYLALRTSRGIRLDGAALDAISSPALTLSRLYDGLGLVSVGSVALSLAACVTLAALRWRFDLALGALVVIGGANISTQILKYQVFAPFDLGDAPNGLPSGHTTVALSIALAAVIVAPSAWRSTVAVGVTATAVLVGVATVLGRWHHPSHVLAATSVCLLWAAVGLLVAAVARRRPPTNVATGSLHLAALVGAAVVGALLVSWGVRPEPGLRDLGLGLISLGSIGLACAACVGVVAHVADRYLG